MPGPCRPDAGRGLIAGLRWDTAGSVGGTGPRWNAGTRSVVSGKFTVRHPTGY